MFLARAVMGAIRPIDLGKISKQLVIKITIRPSALEKASFYTVSKQLAVGITFRPSVLEQVSCDTVCKQLSFAGQYKIFTGFREHSPAEIFVAVFQQHLCIL